MFEVRRVHIGRYGPILCENESYTNNLAIGTIFDPILGHEQIKNVYDTCAWTPNRISPTLQGEA